MANSIETIEIPQGDTRRLPFTVTASDGSSEDLTDATLSWRLGDESEPALSIDSEGVTIRDRDLTNGSFAVGLSADATASVPIGSYREVLTIEDDAGNVTQFRGRVRIKRV